MTARAGRPDERHLWRAVALLALLQAAWALGFIVRSSVVLDGCRYFCLFDDAMISMRYAANWADGLGLVWNPGQRVEGYTNFGWTIILGLCHLLRLSPSHTCLLVQLLGIPIIWGCLLATVRLARVCRLPPLCTRSAVVLTGVWYNLLLLALAGMETALLTCLVTLGLAEGVKAVRRRTGRVSTMLWFAPALLIRSDLLSIVIFVFGFVFLSVRRGHLRVVAGLILAGLPALLHVLWRHHYYGEWVPNTYYLKATGWPLADRLAPGVQHTLWSAVTLGVPFLLALLGLRRRRRWQLLLLGGFLVAGLYQGYVGGDVWPLSRFVIPVSTGVFVLAARGMQRVPQLLGVRVAADTRVRYQALLTVVTLVAMNGVNLDHLLLVARPQIYGQSRRNLRSLVAVERIAAPDATVVVSFAGTFPYFSKRTCVDAWGKCEPHIARLPATPGASLAGHVKQDLAYILETYNPDIVLDTIDTTIPAFVRDYQPVIVEVDGVEVGLSVRKNSPRIHGGQIVDWRRAADAILKARADSAS